MHQTRRITEVRCVSFIPRSVGHIAAQEKMSWLRILEEEKQKQVLWMVIIEEMGELRSCKANYASLAPFQGARRSAISAQSLLSPFGGLGILPASTVPPSQRPASSTQAGQPSQPSPMIPSRSVHGHQSSWTPFSTPRPASRSLLQGHEPHQAVAFQPPRPVAATRHLPAPVIDERQAQAARAPTVAGSHIPESSDESEEESDEEMEILNPHTERRFGM